MSELNDPTSAISLALRLLQDIYEKLCEIQESLENPQFIVEVNDDDDVDQEGFDSAV